MATSEQGDLFDSEAASTEPVAQKANRGFFNTIELRGVELSDARKQARRQEELVLEFFKSQPGIAATPEDIHALMPKGTPITSVRRAITVLTDKGQLAKLPLSAVYRVGQYGKPVHSWKRVKEAFNQPQEIDE